MLDIQTKVTQAHSKLRNYLSPTPLIYANQLSHLTQTKTFLKLENILPTRSFKIRGAFNKLLSLTREECQRGVVTASTGNHGAAVAFGAKHLNIPCNIYVPKTASITKVNAIQSLGTAVQFYGQECGEAEQRARNYADQQNKIYISPYNDIDIIAGQGTIGYELMQQIKNIDVVLAAVGGGGLIAGIAGYMKAFNKNLQVIGCLPENSPVMAECIKAGKIIELETKPTLSDATAGNMDLDSITFSLCQQYVDNYILISETEIKEAICLLLEKEHLVCEGSAATCIASLFKIKEQLKNKVVVIIISGANISTTTLKHIIS